MTTPEALRDLYTALGGSSADVANLAVTPELISALATAAATIAAAILPTVSSTNNGQILTVVNGKWAAADPASQLPTVTATNNGQVLTVVSGEWAAAALPE